MKHKLTFLSLIIALNVSAQEDTTKSIVGPTVTFEQIVSLGYLAKNWTVPFAFNNIDKSELSKKSTGQEPSFILSEQPSMTVYSDAGSGQGYSYFRLRGIDQTRLNLTLDGTPLNEPEDQGVYFSNFPDFFGSIYSVQIQRGVGTSKNGTVSFGGSLQFISPRLTDSMKTSVGAGLGSFNTYRFFVEHNKGNKKNDVGLYIRASHLHSDGYKNRSANTSNSVFYSTGLLKKKHVLKFTGFIGNQRNQMAWLGVAQPDIDKNRKANANSEENDQFTQTLNQIQHSWKISKKSSLKSCIYYNYLQGYYDFDLNNFIGLPSSSEMYNYAFQSHFMGAYSTYNYRGKKLEWNTGVHANIYQRKHTGTERNFGELYQNRGFKNSASAFVKGRYTIKKQYNIFVDVQSRYTDFDYEGSTPFAKRSWNFINPKIGFSYKGESNTFYYSLGSASREPTRNDMFGGWDDLAADSNGVAQLYITDPEFVWDNELGWRFYKKKFYSLLNLYHMSFTNEIVLNGQFGPNGLALNSNVDKSFRTGVELTLFYEPSKSWNFVNNSSFNYSKITQSNVDFHPILTPQLIINQEVVYKLSGFETALSLRYQSSSFIDFANQNELDDYVLLNWRASYTVKGMTVSVFLNNIANKKYYNNGYVDWDGTNKYFVQAPSNVYGMITYSF